MNIPPQAQERLLAVLTALPQVERIWLFGSRAMGREQPGSDLDLCLEAPQLSYSDRLRLLNAVDDLCLPWQVDLVLRHELPAELEEHVQRVGRCLWTQPPEDWPVASGVSGEEAVKSWRARSAQHQRVVRWRNEISRCDDLDTPVLF